jgi:hypothetical protein
LIVFLLLLVGVAAGRADAIDDSAALQSEFDEALLEIHGERWSPVIRKIWRRREPSSRKS